VCPCFGVGDFADAVERCQQEPSYGVFCASDPEINHGVVVNQVSCPGVPEPTFVYKLSVDTNTHECSREQKESGTTTGTSTYVSAVQEAACRQIIVDNGDNVCLQY
jgi:hypothetical protein